MTALNLLRALDRARVHVSVVGGELVLEGPAEPPAELLARVRAVRAELPYHILTAPRCVGCGRREWPPVSAWPDRRCLVCGAEIPALEVRLELAGGAP